MKKIISIILATAMMITISVPAYAAETPESTTEMTNIFIYNGHGEYTLSDIKSTIIENNNFD